MMRMVVVLAGKVGVRLGVKVSLPSGGYLTYTGISVHLQPGDYYSDCH
jgi:hypothetical protein